MLTLIQRSLLPFACVSAAAVLNGCSATTATDDGKTASSGEDLSCIACRARPPEPWRTVLSENIDNTPNEYAQFAEFADRGYFCYFTQISGPLDNVDAITKLYFAEDKNTWWLVV